MTTDKVRAGATRSEVDSTDRFPELGGLLLAEARARAIEADLQPVVRWTAAPGGGAVDGPARVVRVRPLSGGRLELTACRESSAGSFGARQRP